jgi:hypothetical protein
VILFPRRQRPVLSLPGLLLAATVAGCGAPVSSPSASPLPSSPPVPSSSTSPAAEPSAEAGGQPVPGLSWTTATDVERPPDMSAAEPSIPAVGPGGGLGHPGHFPGQGYLVDVADGPAGLVAAGYAWPGWHATAWTSTDGQQWRRHVVDEAENTFLLAIAATHDGYVAVGRAGAGAAAWTSPDGVTWQRAPGEPGPEPGMETRMTTVATSDDGVVAGGWAASPTTPAGPRFWWSADGRSWEPATIDDAGGVNADEQVRVTSVTRGPSGWSAVGTTGPESRPSGSAAWTSADGRSWTRARSSDLVGVGQMASVTATPSGFLAVGSDLDERQGVSWVSADGRDWIASEPQPALDNHGLKIRMTDAVAADGRLVAVGNYLFGTQYGNAMSWTSTDGLTWTPAPRAAALNQGEMLAVAPGGPGYVAVGTFGAPDDYVPTVWLSPRS